VPQHWLFDSPRKTVIGCHRQEEITFTAGTHREVVRMNWEDMARLVNPTGDRLNYQRAAVA
jgi:hypothetical protein